MIHFLDSADKANWNDHLTGSEHAVHLKQVYHESKPGASAGVAPHRTPKTTILLITTPTGNYVKNPNADMGWHTWAIVEVKKQEGGYGKRLYIMDPGLPNDCRDADLSKASFKDMKFSNAQRKCIEFNYNRAPHTTTLWVGRPGKAAPDKDRCVRDTCEWIDTLAKTEDKGWVQGEVDARFPGFQEAGARLK